MIETKDINLGFTGFPDSEFGGSYLPEIDYSTQGVLTDFTEPPEIYAPTIGKEFKLVTEPNSVTDRGEIITPEERAAIENQKEIDNFQKLATEPVFKAEPAPESVYNIFYQYNIDANRSQPEILNAVDPELNNQTTAEPEAEQPEIILTKNPLFCASNRGCVVGTIIIIVILVLILFKK